ncbi:class I SAM-dependent methyltransferase [Thiocapsa sp.]|uniref:class I SAM-dependent methyltransferase n=1 Tax=Thiocapsa sp. TaxID=2024551 RepID=UPI002C3F4C51|nr:class I SAM-dependent methyltransferase [Thiocapsa sp.]HSO81670.1 class I SAM-dependent methyltransferase [Thiocapsa sp.]
MPTIEENLKHWSGYDWSLGGDEWSSLWGGTENLWLGAVLPRVADLLPTGRLVEIAPGFGRMTQFLETQCRSMTLVDLTERCIDACRQRFADKRHIDYVVNDGRSLPGVADQSVDLVFSFDSLVHVELDVIDGYVSELSRVLRPEGTAFIHHSNMAAFRHPEGEGFTIENRHWRGGTVSADIVKDLCDRIGLTCYRQELVNWGGKDLTDSFSYIARRGSSRDRPRELIRNQRFMEERIRLYEHARGVQEK